MLQENIASDRLIRCDSFKVKAELVGPEGNQSFRVTRIDTPTKKALIYTQKNVEKFVFTKLKVERDRVVVGFVCNPDNGATVVSIGKSGSKELWSEDSRHGLFIIGNQPQERRILIGCSGTEYGEEGTVYQRYAFYKNRMILKGLSRFINDRWRTIRGSY